MWSNRKEVALYNGQYAIWWRKRIGMTHFLKNDIAIISIVFQVEVVRQVMKDLDALLRAHNPNYYLPRHAVFQFDNCNENKVLLIHSTFYSSDAFVLPLESVFIRILE